MRVRLTRQPQYPAQIDWSNPVTHGLEFAALPVGGTYFDCVTREFGEAAGVYPVAAWPLNDGAASTPHALAAAGTNSTSTQILWPISLSRGGSIAGASAQGTMLVLGGRATTSNGVTPLLANTEIVSAGHGFSLWLDDYGFAYQGAVIRGNYSDTVRYSSQILSTGSIPARNKLLFFGFAFDNGGTNGDWLGSRRSQAWSGDSFLIGSTTTNRRARLLTPGYNNGTLNTTGYVALGLIWSRRLSLVEYQSLYDNPWQIFSRRIDTFVVPGAALQTLSLIAGAGAFTVAGQAAALKTARRLVAQTGAFAVGGQAAALRAAYRLKADAGAFSVAGQATVFARGYALKAGAGAFALSGQAAGLSITRSLAASAGSFVLTGQAAAFVRARRLAAGTGAFGLTGQAAGLNVAGNSTLMANAGSFGVTGQAAALRASRRLTGAPGAFTLSGQAARLTRSRRLVAEPGAFAYVGQAAGLNVLGHSTLAAQAGAFAVTGQAAGLRAGRRLTAGAGAFVVTGQPATLRWAHRLVAGPGAFVLTGREAALNATGFLRFGAGAGAFVMSGAAVEFTLVRGTLPGRIGGRRRPVLGSLRPAQMGGARPPQRM